MKLFLRTKAYFLSVLLGSTVACSDKPPFTEATCQSTMESVIQNDINKMPESNSIYISDTIGLPQTRYVSDKDHSSISFRTGHWEIVDIIGWFSDFEVLMFSDSLDFSDAVIYAVVDPLSIIMPNKKMAGTASKAPYIDSEKFPKITFRSSNMEKQTDGNYLLRGQMQMNGIEKDLAFDVDFNGFAYPGEKSICGFTVEGKIDRHDFGIGGVELLHSGKQVHDDNIQLYMDLRME